MSSKFCLRKRGFWKKFLQKRYVKIKTLFYSSGRKMLPKNVEWTRKSCFFWYGCFQSKFTYPQILTSEKKVT